MDSGIDEGSFVMPTVDGSVAFARNSRNLIGVYRIGANYSLAGKRGERAYSYYELDLGDTWIEGQRDDGEYYW